MLTQSISSFQYKLLQSCVRTFCETTSQRRSSGLLTMKAANCAKRFKTLVTRDHTVVDFLNYREDWEDDKIKTKNRAHEGLLNDKYQHIYLYDAEKNERAEKGCAC